MNQSWGFSKIWNDSLERDDDRRYEPREHIWASEIGGAMVDRYLKMKGVQPTNPPNPRSQRKFEAGNIWEHIVGFVLKRAGILIDAQKRLEYQYPGLLKVTGRLDYMAGGNPDYDKALDAIQTEFNWLPAFVSRATKNIVEKLKEQYPNGLKEIILEIKSCSAYMFEVYETNEDASPQHKCQNFHYLKADGKPEGHVVYISKDDARIAEYGVFNPSYVEDLYRQDIETLTGYIKSGEQPPIEKPLVYEKGRFSANWKIAYSQYLTHLYGFKNQMEFDERYKGTPERWNRVLGRIREGKELTANNLEAISEIEREGFDFEKIKTEMKGE